MVAPVVPTSFQNTNRLLDISTVFLLLVVGIVKRRLMWKQSLR